MAVVTVKHLSQVVGTPIEKMLRILDEAGIPKRSADDLVSDSEKLRLLTHLRESRGVHNRGSGKRITLKRKRVSEIKTDSSGQREHSVEVLSRKISDSKNITGPNVFISYSYDSTKHEKWVEKLAEKLRSDGVDAILDRWVLHPGDPITEFMERSITESDFVLIVCTEKYKHKSDTRRGGVGYEEAVISSELFNSNNHRKFQQFPAS